MTTAVEYACRLIRLDADASDEARGGTSEALNLWAARGWHPVGAPQVVPVQARSALDPQGGQMGIGLLFVLRREASLPDALTPR